MESIILVIFIGLMVFFLYTYILKIQEEKRELEEKKHEEEVRIQGFGTFKKSKRAARTGVNPQNPKEKIKIPAMNVVTFKAGSEFKALVK
jgi:nucleoid DNA-binding protein